LRKCDRQWIAAIPKQKAFSLGENSTRKKYSSKLAIANPVSRPRYSRDRCIGSAPVYNWRSAAAWGLAGAVGGGIAGSIGGPPGAGLAGAD